MACRDYNSSERRCRHVFRSTDSHTFPDSDYGTAPCFLRGGGYNTTHPGNARTSDTGAGNTGACTCAILGTRAGGHGGNRDLSRHPNGQCTPCPEGDIHYHIYVPDGYNGSKAYALFLTLPGYEGLYFQGMGRSLYSENFAFEALNYNDHMIVAVPQLSGLGGDFN